MLQDIVIEHFEFIKLMNSNEVDNLVIQLERSSGMILYE
jgi:hypothetical protein